MLKLILIAFIVFIAIALILASTKPDTFRIERSIDIKAPPEKIFPLIAVLLALRAVKAPCTRGMATRILAKAAWRFLKQRRHRGCCSN
jgi:hypothetical protein